MVLFVWLSWGVSCGAFLRNPMGCVVCMSLPPYCHFTNMQIWKWHSSSVVWAADWSTKSLIVNSKQHREELKIQIHVIYLFIFHLMTSPFFYPARLLDTEEEENSKGKTLFSHFLVCVCPTCTVAFINVFFFSPGNKSGYIFKLTMFNVLNDDRFMSHKPCEVEQSPSLDLSIIKDYKQGFPKFELRSIYTAVKHKETNIFYCCVDIWYIRIIYNCPWWR